MNKESFIEINENLINLINEYLANQDIYEHDKSYLRKLLELLSQYSYENRLKVKGLLSHTIIDCMELDYSLGEKFIKFDYDIK